MIGSVPDTRPVRKQRQNAAAAVKSWIVLGAGLWVPVQCCKLSSHAVDVRPRPVNAPTAGAPMELSLCPRDEWRHELCDLISVNCLEAPVTRQAPAERGFVCTANMRLNLVDLLAKALRRYMDSSQASTRGKLSVAGHKHTVFRARTVGQLIISCATVECRVVS